MGAEAVAGLPASGTLMPAGAGAQRSNGALILVVDDDPLNRTVMSAMLNRLGYRFDLASNGREAIEAVCRERYAAVLMDCLMPEMDGYEATSAIRELERAGQSTWGPRHLPIIAVTAVAIQGARERCIAAGMDDYLSKPVMMESILTLLDRWTACAEVTEAWNPPCESAADEPEEDAVDRAAIEALRGLDPDGLDGFVVQMIDDFRSEVSPRLEVMALEAGAGDVRSLLQELHFVAGCASIVGATRLERLARSLDSEDAFLAAGGTTGAVALVARLRAEMQRVETTLAALAASER